MIFFKSQTLLNKFLNISLKLSFEDKVRISERSECFVTIYISGLPYTKATLLAEVYTEVVQLKQSMGTI